MPFFFSFFFLFISNLFSHLNAVKSLSSCSPFFSFLLFSRSTFYFNAPHFFAFCFFTNERFLFFFLLLIFLGIRFEIWFLLSASTLFFFLPFLCAFSACVTVMKDAAWATAARITRRERKKKKEKEKTVRWRGWANALYGYVLAFAKRSCWLISAFFFLKLLLSFFFFLTALADVARVGCNDSVGVCVC